MINQYFFSIAQQTSQVAGPPIKPEWVYSQFAHETGGFTSALQASNHNLGGLCQTQANDSPQPDGDEYYMEFATFEDYAQYFGHYITLYADNGIMNSQTVDDYITALKNGGYFGDDLDTYLSDVKAIMVDNFPGVA